MWYNTPVGHPKNEPMYNNLHPLWDVDSDLLVWSDSWIFINGLCSLSELVSTVSATSPTKQKHVLWLNISQVLVNFSMIFPWFSPNPSIHAPGCVGSAHPLPRSHQHHSAWSTGLAALSSPSHDLAQAVSTWDGRRDQAVDLRHLAHFWARVGRLKHRWNGFKMV